METIREIMGCEHEGALHFYEHGAGADNGLFLPRASRQIGIGYHGLGALLGESKHTRKALQNTELRQSKDLIQFRGEIGTSSARTWRPTSAIFDSEFDFVFIRPHVSLQLKMDDQAK